MPEIFTFPGNEVAGNVSTKETLRPTIGRVTFATLSNPKPRQPRRNWYIVLTCDGARSHQSPTGPKGLPLYRPKELREGRRHWAER